MQDTLTTYLFPFFCVVMWSYLVSKISNVFISENIELTYGWIAPGLVLQDALEERW